MTDYFRRICTLWFRRWIMYTNDDDTQEETSSFSTEST